MRISQKNRWIKHIDFIAIDLVCEIIAFAAAYYLKFGHFGFVDRIAWRMLLLVLCLVKLVATFVLNPYSGIFYRPYYADAIKLAEQSLVVFIAINIFFYVMKMGAVFSRVSIVLNFLIHYFLALSLIWLRKWQLLKEKRKSLRERRRKLLVIARRSGIDVVTENILAGDAVEYEIAGYCFVGEEADGPVPDGCRVVAADEAASFVEAEHIEDVFVAALPHSLPKGLCGRLVENGVTVHFDLEKLAGAEGDDQFISHIGVYKAAGIGPYTFGSRQLIYFVFKRVLDIVFSAVGCLLLLPLAAVIKLCCLCSGDRMPIFYSQTRVGRDGRTFKLYKFRSMVPDADERLLELLQQEPYREQWEASQKLDDDPRITRVGRFLRRTSLDEVPQFINVLLGDMSVIGPRPLVVGELEEHGGLRLYNRVKPGITGWWACNGRSNINYKERLELEYYYVKNCSLQMDVLCLLRTVWAVLKREGAQ